MSAEKEGTCGHAEVIHQPGGSMQVLICLGGCVCWVDALLLDVECVMLIGFLVKFRRTVYAQSRFGRREYEITKLRYYQAI